MPGCKRGGVAVARNFFLGGFDEKALKLKISLKGVVVVRDKVLRVESVKPKVVLHKKKEMTKSKKFESRLVYLCIRLSSYGVFFTFIY